MGFIPYLVIFLVFFASQISAEVYSCGGFVRAHSSIDYSKVTVKLLTTEGHLKHEEEVNPSNGYFMIPVYNKGKYVLKVSSPAGYHFEPKEYNLKVDGINDVCSKNEDIIFQLNGFSIRGKVDGAAAGLSLVLSQNGNKIDQTVTGENGQYELKAPPGKYEVSTGVGSSECISRGKADVQIVNSPVEVKPNFQISGYQLNIAVETSKKQSFENAELSIFSESNIDLPNVQCQKIEKVTEVPSSYQFQCKLGKTGKNGKLNVACIPSKNYYLKASFKNVNFAPKVQKVFVSQKTEEVKFVAESVSSRVRVTAKEKPLSDVVVLLNSQKVGKTDAQGYVQINNLKEGIKNVITAETDHVQFSTVNVNVKFPHFEINDINVVKFDICGTVEKSENNVIENLKLTRIEDKKTINVVPNSDGAFCQSVTPGKYNIEPTETTSSLTPKSLIVDVSYQPFSNLRFTHFKTDAIVRVTCIEACQTSTISLYLPGNVLVRSIQGTDVFVFENIGPGIYTAKLNDNGRGCWDSSELQLTVEQSNKQPTIHFVQNGFSVRIDITAPATIKWSHVENRQLLGEKQSPGGLLSICVPMSGKYIVELESCYKFEHQHFELIVPFDGIHRERAIAAKVGGKIDLEGDKKAGVSIRIRSSEAEQEVTVSSSDGRFSFDQPLGERTNDILHLIPISVVRLFEPTSKSVKFKGKCVDNAVEFKSYRGIFIDGTIKPPVENVEILAVLRADPSVQIKQISDKKGNYKIGPIKRVEDYDITATLEGFKFLASSQAGNFESVKLSQLTIKVIDEATNEPLDGVLLSLVGGKGAGNEYRSNNILDSTAQKRFVALAPGEYFVRAILQEYKFAPTTTTIQVHEGQHENLVLKGKRVSFSGFGKIKEMSSVAVSDVIVEALSIECDQHQSEAVTGNDGSFRLRGLLPNCNYNVYAKAFSDGTAAPHSFPKQFRVQMTAEDVKGLDFIVSTVEKTTDVAVEIDMLSLKGVQSVRVIVHKGHNLVQSTSVSFPQTLFYLSNLPRDGQEYSIRVESEKPAQLFAAKTAFFTADVAVRVVRIPLTSSKKASEVDISVGSLLSLPFFILLALAFFNQNHVIEIFKALYNFATAPNPTGDNQRKRK